MIFCVSRINFSHSYLNAVHPTTFSAAQLQMSAMESSFSREACNGRSLLAMMAGSFAFRIGRLAALESFASLGLMRNTFVAATARALAFTSALAGEVTVFRGLNQVLSPEIISPEASFLNPQTWMSTFVDFFALKTMGHFGAGNILLSHLAQDAAVVAGHHLGFALGFTPEAEGSLTQQLLYAEAMNLQMSVGMKLAGILGGSRLHVLERNLIHRTTNDFSSPARCLASEGAPTFHAESKAVAVEKSPYLPQDAAELSSFIGVDNDTFMMEEVTSQPSSGVHLRRSKEKILEAATMALRREEAQSSERQVAVIFGAGNCSEIPVVELVREKNYRITLVDLSEEALTFFMETLPEDVSPHVRGVVADLTHGVFFDMVRDLRELESLAEQSLPRRLTVIQRLIGRLENLELYEAQRDWLSLAGETAADLVVSSMIPNQLYITLNAKIRALLEYSREDLKKQRRAFEAGRGPEYFNDVHFLRLANDVQSRSPSILNALSIGSQTLHRVEIENLLKRVKVAYCSIDVSYTVLTPHSLVPIVTSSFYDAKVKAIHLRDSFRARKVKIQSEDSWTWEIERTDERPELIEDYGSEPRCIHWKDVEALILTGEAFEMSLRPRVKVEASKLNASAPPVARQTSPLLNLLPADAASLIQWMDVTGHGQGLEKRNATSHWQAHLAQNRKHLLGAADQFLRNLPEGAASQRPRAVLLGAGASSPVVELIERGFEVVLVDLDEQTLLRVRERLPESMRPYLALRVEDVSGGDTFDLAQIAYSISERRRRNLIDSNQAIHEYSKRYRDWVGRPRRTRAWMETERPTFVESSMMIGQMHRFPLHTLLNLMSIRADFHPSVFVEGTNDLTQTIGRVLRSHVEDLSYMAQHGHTVYLSSDVVDFRRTGLRPVTSIAHPILFATNGSDVQDLAALLPEEARPLIRQSHQWTWQHTLVREVLDCPAEVRVRFGNEVSYWKKVQAIVLSLK